MILYLDGFDEFGEGKEGILDLVGIKSDAKLQDKLKVIVSCRSTEISSDQIKDIFYLRNQFQSSDHGYICPINSQQLKEYLGKFVDTVNQYNSSHLMGKFESFKTSKEYEDMMESNQSLKEMAKEPFTIRLLVGIMPRLK